ncbi:hypothetical protein N7G274_006372 [Stereocaulon virgatum]|uniref:Uncharacterized protein n=1 Tax=Stereocaulon virgatum TaxID=373712 RepID=A0ABR4A5Z9_9LECA
MSPFTPINKPPGSSSQDESGSMTGQVRAASNPTVEHSAVARTRVLPRRGLFTTHRSSNADKISATAAPSAHTPGSLAGALSPVPSQGHHVSPYANSITDTGQNAAAESSVNSQVFHDSTNIGPNLRAGRTAAATRRNVRRGRVQARQTSSRGAGRRPLPDPPRDSQHKDPNSTNTAQNMCPQPIQRSSEAAFTQATGAPIQYAGPPVQHYELITPTFPMAVPISNTEALWGRVVETTHAQIQAARDYHMAVKVAISFTSNPWTNSGAPTAFPGPSTQSAADTPYFAQACHDSQRIQWHQEGSLNSHGSLSTRYDSRQCVTFQTGQEQAPNSDVVVPASEHPVSSRINTENVATQTTHNADSELQDGNEAARGGKQKQAQDGSNNYPLGEEEDAGRVADASMRQITSDEDATESDSEFRFARGKKNVEMTNCEITASQQEERTQEQEGQEQLARNTGPQKRKLSEEERVGGASLESSDQKKLKTATARSC